MPVARFVTVTYGRFAFPTLAGLKAMAPSADTAPGSTRVVARGASVIVT